MSFGEHLASILDQKLSKHILLNLNSVTRENKKLEKYISNRNYEDIWRYMIDGSSDVDVSAIEVFFAAIYINKQKQIDWNDQDRNFTRGWKWDQDDIW